MMQGLITFLLLLYFIGAHAQQYQSQAFTSSVDVEESDHATVTAEDCDAEGGVIGVSLPSENTTGIMTLTNWNFTIPTEANITDFHVEISRQTPQDYQPNTLYDSAVFLVGTVGNVEYDGSVGYWAEGVEIVSYKSWSVLALSPSQVNSKQFGIHLEFSSNSTSEVDGAINCITLVIGFQVPVPSSTSGSSTSASSIVVASTTSSKPVPSTSSSTASSTSSSSSAPGTSSTTSSVNPTTSASTTTSSSREASSSTTSSITTSSSTTTSSLSVTSSPTPSSSTTSKASSESPVASTDSSESVESEANVAHNQAPSASHSSERNQAAIMAGSIVGAAAVTGLVVFGIAFFLLRNRHKGQRLPQTSSRESENGDSDKTEVVKIDTLRGIIVDGDSPPSYEESSSMPNTPRVLSCPDNQWEIEYASLSIESEVGRGSSGIVLKGRWRSTPVAVKKLLVDRLTKQQLEDFHRETMMLRSLRPHANVVQFFGGCSHPVAIVTEYLANGNLSSYLKTQTLDPSVRVQIALGIARGMLHIHLEKIIHRDLAARNVLLTASMVPKISDFGLSRPADKDVNQTNNPVGPLKWMAPEALSNNVYSTKTDVWSYAITLLELYTGNLPFPNREAVAVALGFVNQTIDFPSLMPAVTESRVLEVYLNALNYDPNLRPDFGSICNDLESICT